MSRVSITILSVLSILCLAGAAGADHSLVGQLGVPYSGPQIRPEMLFQGDLVPEIGIGCSNLPGTSGGPNDVAVGVTATMTPPLGVTSVWYNIYTQVSPNITALSFVCWTAINAPGAEIARRPGMPWSQGTHTSYVSPLIIVHDHWFFVGFSQPQTNVGMRWGLDTSPSSAGNSYIKAPGCGLSEWSTLDSIGYPGNWCMAVAVDMASPTELQSWGEVKNAFK